MEQDEEDAAPLILAAALDDETFARLDALRREHFPPERNVLSAHLTMFHKLPGLEIDAVVADLAEVTARTPPLPLRVAAPFFMGRGSAFAIEAPGLRALRATLARRWEAWLTPQDAQPWRPHVTVQNKVERDEARALHAALSAAHEPWEGTCLALALWRYRGGPWEAEGVFALRG